MEFSSQKQFASIRELTADLFENVLHDEQPVFISDEATLLDVSLRSPTELMERCSQYYRTLVAEEDLRRPLWQLLPDLENRRNARYNQRHGDGLEPFQATAETGILTECSPMINLSDLNGKRLAMIAWSKTADGEDDVAVFSGVASWDGDVLTMRREPDTTAFVVPADWHSRLRPVDADLKATVLGAEYCFSVSVGALGDDDSSDFLSTGLKWPTHDDADNGEN